MIKGLTDEEVQKRIEEGKVNKSDTNNLKSNFEIIRDNVCTLFNLFNLIIAIALACVKAYTNMVFILIIIINVLIGIIQEIHGRNLVKKLSILTTMKCKVIRNGKEQDIDINEIVVDDIVLLAQGDQIPSDAFVLDGEIEVNESLLTGESDTILKTKEDKLLSGSYVVSGKCYAKIEKVGDDNFANQIINAGKKQKKINSELLNSMKKVTNFTSFVIIPVGVILFIQAFVFREVNLQQSVIATAAALLGMLPKGFVLLTSISLESGVIKLAKKEVLVQDLYSVETLAHIDTLCLDKTGTITEGKMKVIDIEKYNGDILPDTLENIMTAYVNTTDDTNNTFLALKNKFKGKNTYEKISDISFSSERKWSSVTFKDIGTIVVGAPERLVIKAGIELPEIVLDAQKNGKRALCIGYTKESVTSENLPELKIIASIILADPLRKNAKEMLGYFKTQSVDIKIISGDNPITVSTIAKRAGLEDYESYIDLSTLKSDAEIVDIVDKYSIFARVLPHQKSIIVKALQAKGHKVAMTGDGVNDVIALRESDLSITLPEANDAAKQVSQIVLLNQDFSVLKDVLMEGRRVVNNLTNVARIFFIKTIYSMILSVFCILTNTAFPFIPIQITLIDLAIEAYTSFFISFEPNNKPVKGIFLHTVLRNATPFAIVIMLNIIFLTFMQPVLGIAQGQLVTIMYLLIGFVSILAVLEVCIPFNKLHVFLFSTTFVGFFTAVYLFRNLLQITSINMREFGIFVVFALISTIILTIKQRIYKKLGY
jgi:cation-transporting ATPase E